MVALPKECMAGSPAVWARRGLIFLLGSAIIIPQLYQRNLDDIYAFLYTLPVYRSSTFETFWTVITYAIIEVSYTYRYAHNPHLRLANLRDEGPPTGKPIPKMQRPSKRLKEALIYVIPLLTMDLTMIKKFRGVPINDMALTGNYDPSTVNMRGNFLAPTLHRFTLDSPLQTQRALPPHPPTTRQLALQLTASILLYDALFFLFHLGLHKISPLNKIHSFHHKHSEINPQITNQLDIIERLGLVLLANFSLNIIGAHVVTRTLFVPLFVWLLVDIHSGMDHAWGYDKLLPQGWAAGSRRHSEHHQRGQKYYEPFFTWWDDAYEWITRKRATEHG